MSALEERIRRGLNVDRAVPDMLDAVHEGARRRRAQRRTVTAAVAAAFVVVAIAVGATLSSHGKGEFRPAPAVTPPPSTVEPAPPTFPGRDEGVISAAAAGGRVFVLTDRETLWTLVDGVWSAQRNLPIAKHTYYEIAFSPNGDHGVIHPFVWAESETRGSEAPSAAVLVSSDGGHRWSIATMPTACGCGATVTDAGFFYLGADGIYRSDDGLSKWRRTGPAPSDSIFASALFARGGSLVVHSRSDEFAVSADAGRTWQSLPSACQMVGSGYRPDHQYVFDMGISSGEEIVEDCHHRNSHQIVHTVDLTRWERVGPTFQSTAICCYPISDDAAVGAGIVVASSGVREIQLSLEQNEFGSFAAHAGDATYLAYMGHLFASYDGLTWTELTR